MPSGRGDFFFPSRLWGIVERLQIKSGFIKCVVLETTGRVEKLIRLLLMS